MSRGHIFFQGVLAAVASVGGVAGDVKGLEPEPGASWSFSSVQWPSLPYQGGSRFALAAVLRVGSKLVLFQVCALPAPSSGVFAPKGEAVLEQEGLEQVFSSGWGWGACWGDHGKPARAPGSFSLLPLPYFRSKQACAHASRMESRFLTALLLVPLVFKPAKGTHLPGVGP